MQFVIVIVIIIVIWLLAHLIVAVAANIAARLAAPFLGAMRLVNASLGSTPYDAELYVLLHGLLGGAIGLLAHMMVRRLSSWR